MDHSHISEQFNHDLESVQTQVLAMGGMVETQLRDACEVLAHGTDTLAEAVLEKEIQVNKMEIEIDELCTQVIARRQPTASDLRLVTGTIKTITDLERIGDEAEKIARLGMENIRLEHPANRYPEVRHLGNHVRVMLHDALDAYARMDADAAFKVLQEDDQVDEEYEAILRQLITLMMEDPRAIRRALNTMWSVRAMERIGDHATNICEYIIYYVKGKDVRHGSLEQTLDALE
ncbi:MAG: phosphate signaling complex protein PhoU [Pseudomonadales bacterium]|jgi:phosphate transport system protein|nr:phosphate signaling complex protein PhoU [Pseudomonadales bacterium]